jgi:hypothetical protein
MLIKKRFYHFHKQTILGPIWFYSALLTMAMYVVLLVKCKLSTDGLPQVAF